MLLQIYCDRKAFWPLDDCAGAQKFPSKTVNHNYKPLEVRSQVVNYMGGSPQRCGGI